jgi:hypothetical protein
MKRRRRRKKEKKGVRYQTGRLNSLSGVVTNTLQMYAHNFFVNEICIC